jgi:predicted acyl esterase
VALEVASTATDGAFFAYLEDVDPDGHVTFLDDGELRAVSRRLVDPTKLPYTALGPMPSTARQDAQPLVPRESAELKFLMWPTSVVLQKRHCLRLALAGADAGSFPRYPKVGDVTWTVYREAAHASYVELPLRPRQRAVLAPRIRFS